MAYSHKSRKSGKTYHLHKKGRLFYFSADPKGAIDMPPGYTVVESERTGLPLLKKK